MIPFELKPQINHTYSNSAFYKDKDKKTKKTERQKERKAKHQKDMFMPYLV